VTVQWFAALVVILVVGLVTTMIRGARAKVSVPQRMAAAPTQSGHVSTPERPNSSREQP